MLNVDRAWNITCDALEPIVLRFRWEFPDGTPREVPGEAWGMQIHGPGVPGGQITAAGVIATTMIDGVEAQYVECRHAPSVGPAIAGLPGLRWKFGERLPEGQVARSVAALIAVSPVPDMSLPAPLIGEGEINTFVMTWRG